MTRNVAINLSAALLNIIIYLVIRNGLSWINLAAAAFSIMAMLAIEWEVHLDNLEWKRQKELDIQEWRNSFPKFRNIK